MRKLYAFLVTLLLVAVPAAFSQVSLYTFSQSNGTYTPITGGTVLATATGNATGAPSIDDSVFPLANGSFPFTFTFNGVGYTGCNVSSNGHISFGATATGTTNYTPISSTTAYAGAVSAFGGDINSFFNIAGQTGELRWEVVGTAPNREVVIQWSNFRPTFTNSTTNVYSFSMQIRLAETSNQVRVVYGGSLAYLVGSTTISGTRQVGLRGATNADFNNRTNATTTNYTASTAGGANTSTQAYNTNVTPPGMPSSGLTYTWAPPPPCTGVPSPGSISGPAAALCSGASATLTLSGYSAGVTGISFQWNQSSTPGGPYTPIPGATGTSYTYTTNATAYFTATVTCSNSGLSANTTQFTVNVNKPVHSNLSATPAVACSPGSSTLTGTVSGGITTGGSGIIVSSGAINLAIPDNNAAGINTSLTVPASTNIPTAADLKIRINASHTWLGDLKFTLTSPCGTTFLFDRPGFPAAIFGNSDNLGTSNVSPNPPPAIYTFDLAGATVIPETSTIPGFVPTGTYRPSDVSGVPHNWAGFTFPCTAAGTWTLNLSDNAGGDEGRLVDWAIIGPTSGNYTHTLTGPGTIGAGVFTGANNATATFNVTNVPAGTHTYTLTSTDVTGCSVSSPITFTVNPTPVVTLTPSSSTICAGAVQQITASTAPGITQTFSSGTISVVIPDNIPAGVNTAPIVLPSGVTVGSASQLRVRINLTHTWIGDLKFTLTSPCGTTFLFDRPGFPAAPAGNSMNFAGQYIFDLSAAAVLPEISLGSNVPVPTGNYRPSDAGGAAHNWAGLTFPCAATGNWVLNLSDNALGDNGTLTEWAILYDAPVPVVFSPATGLFTNSGATTQYIAGTPVTTVWASPATTTTYTATATLSGCNSAPVTHTVTVNQLPAITAQPVAPAAPVCPGFNVNFSVTATGAGLNYQWQVSTDNGTTWNDAVNGAQYINVTTATMTALNVQTSQSGYRFRVIVGGTCPPAVTSSPVTLVVATPPAITTQPASLTRCEGTSATFTVVATGVPTPTIFQWQVSTDGGTTYTNIATGTTASYTIAAVTNAMNNNRYRVIVTNNCGQSITSAAAVLTVNALSPVSITALPTRICLSDTLVALNATPVGGSWSGIGVSGFNFLPGITAVGTYNLTYTYVNPAGCTSSATVAAKVEDCPERIRLLREDGALLYPNPNSGQFFIKVNSTLYEYLGMTVYSTSGQRVYQRTFNGLVYGRVIPVNITHLPAGTYMVKVFYDDGENTGEKTFTVVVGRQ